MFRTEIEPCKSKLKLDQNTSIVTLGSCFSDSIGGLLKAKKFNTFVNPFGTIFNPLSLFELLEYSFERSEILEEATLKRDGYYMNYKFHSSFRAKTKPTLHKRIEQTLQNVSQKLKKAEVVFITFGTAWVYQEHKSQMLVANCHKVPQKEFERRLLTPEEIVSSFFNLKELINQYNDNLKFVFTVSPVRHTRDTLKMNSVSKSVLRSSCHYLEELEEKAEYFPAYEIMTDDLRDYRFYEKDLIHPNEQAIEYIWDFFCSTFLTKEATKLLERWNDIDKAIKHKPFNPKSGGHQKFIQKTLQKLYELKSDLPVQPEIDQLKKALK